MVMKQKVSELLDGELADEHLESTLAHLRDDPEASDDWAAYQLIGDALRGDLSTGSRIPERVQAALRQEPTVLAPPRRKPIAHRLGVRVGLAAAAAVATVSMVAFVARQQATDVVPSAAPVASVDNYLRQHRQLIPGSGVRGTAQEDDGFRLAGYPDGAAPPDGSK
jgi:sigma-E factor negative regulatory protein RseA